MPSVRHRVNAAVAGDAVADEDRVRVKTAACELDGRLYLSPADGKVYRLSEKGDAWEEVGALRQPRIVHRLLPIGKNRMLVVGGSSKGAPTAELEEVHISN